VSKANIHPQHLRTSGGKLKKFGGTVQQAGQKLDETGQSLVSHASGDRSGIGAVVAKATGRASEIAGKVLQEGGRVAGSAGDRLGKTADLYEEADTTAAKNLRKHHPGNKGKVDPPGGTKRSGSTVGKGGAGSGKKPKSVPGGDTHPVEKVGSRQGGKDAKAPTIPGGGDEPASLKGRLPDPNSVEGRLPELLERHGVTQEEFNSMRHRMNQPGGTANVTREEAAKWREIREDIPFEKGMPVQKVLSPDAAALYLGDKQDPDFKPNEIRGCFARTVDAHSMRTPGEYREGLRLDYDDHTFPAGLDSVHVFRTTVEDPNKYDVPYGGPTQQGRDNIGGTKDWGDPFTGDGFTGSDQHLVPEWERQPSAVQEGDQILRVDSDGFEHPVATYHVGIGWNREEG
jgi:hypothetical protein